ncbi:NADH-quinone oxidoreductase subunit NuoF [Acinetobacter apis]|uniref:NADH-quinone oxidoreductase subunit F n=1 Tax=Acinetobacter apis TaxID=1229165 RepID=A0A217EFW8_9GAMM|nr:NADH-quinone oxidoreductase subunit NuoF [Acinetobacter apis]SNQ29247.1 NADH dehydrogenase subunit F [Acinetobacter apis]
MNTEPKPVYGDGNPETHPLTWRLSQQDHVHSLADYERLEGYAGFKKALTMKPAEVLDVIKAATVKGRGGAGFPAGIKWSLMAPNDFSGPRYLICNADEMEPGTFKDRLLMERLPHQLIEGMLIAAYTLEATHGYIFIRGEYIEAAKYLNDAIAQLHECGYLGDNILQSGWGFELHVHTGAGRYICGEETALINSLEGRRANPRTKPPFPQVAGAWGRPTIVNNVETYNNLPAILIRGAEWYIGLSKDKSKDPGTKIYGASGKVKFPGLWELPFGTTAREVIEDHAGGMQDGLTLKAWLPGGASTDFLTPDHLDLPMDSDSIMKAGSRLGTCLLMVFDEQQCMVAATRNLEEFFARESCGFCTPCRDGLPWSVKALRAIENGQGKMEDIQHLQELTKKLWIGKTFCAHAPGAMEPLQSALKYWRHEFEAKIQQPALAPTYAEQA